MPCTNRLPPVALASEMDRTTFRILTTVASSTETTLSSCLPSSSSPSCRPAIDTPDVPRQRSPLALAPFHTLQAEHPDKVLDDSCVVVLKDDPHSPPLTIISTSSRPLTRKTPSLLKVPSAQPSPQQSPSRATPVVSPTSSSNVSGKCQKSLTSTRLRYSRLRHSALRSIGTFLNPALVA